MVKQLRAWIIHRLEKLVAFQLVNKIISFPLAHKIHPFLKILWYRSLQLAN